MIKYSPISATSCRSYVKTRNYAPISISLRPEDRNESPIDGINMYRNSSTRAQLMVCVASSWELPEPATADAAKPQKNKNKVFSDLVISIGEDFEDLALNSESTKYAWKNMADCQL